MNESPDPSYDAVCDMIAAAAKRFQEQGCSATVALQVASDIWIAGIEAAEKGDDDGSDYWKNN